MIKNINLLEKESPLPLYYQLKEIIKSQIEQGYLKPGDLIPSERELVERYKISRPTVRQAINELVIEGLLTRIKGRGTFVAKPKIDHWFLESLTSFTEEMEKKGLKTSTKVLDLKVVEADSKLISIFGSEQNTFYRLERLRYVESQPVVLVTTFVPCSIAPNLEDEDLENNSLYNLLQNKYGHRIDSASRILESVIVSEEDATKLGIDRMSAIFLIRTKGYLSDGRTFEYSIARYRGDLTSFRVSLKYRNIEEKGVMADG